ncbi:MAG: hypothetical protein ACK4NF_05810, partial [Planctomycetota bacterium]
IIVNLPFPSPHSLASSEFTFSFPVPISKVICDCGLIPFISFSYHHQIKEPFYSFKSKPSND